jgi:hypothetical protein
MNQWIAIVAGVFLIGLVYFACAHFRHGSCDTGKLFGMLIVVGSMVTGIYLCIHAVELARASQSDAVWIAVAGCTLTLFSLQQVIVMFRELFATKVVPTKLTREEKERLEV